MSDGIESPRSGVFWSVIKANVTSGGRDSDHELNEWWSHHHVPLYVAREGFHRAWRLRRVEHDASRGEVPQYYFAVYAIESVDVFVRALAEESWGPFQDSVGDWITDWGRTYYRPIFEYQSEDDEGRFWAVVQADPNFSDHERIGEFNRWYDEKHVPEICAHAGFHRAWRLEVLRDNNELGPSGHRYWAVYQVDSPDDFARALKARAEAGIQLWDGLWLPHMKSWGISFHQLIHKEVHGIGTVPGFSHVG
jgi:hypothetical protein